VQRLSRRPMNASITTAAKEAHDRRDHSLLAERRAVVAVPAADCNRLGHVSTQKLVRLRTQLYSPTNGSYIKVKKRNA